MLLQRILFYPAAGLLTAAAAGFFPHTSPQSAPPSPDTAQVANNQADTQKERTPYGRFAELHSCELFTGGCTASSEATLEGRYMLRVWKFEGGYGTGGTPLAGLTAVLLEKSSDNLAEREVSASQAVAYIPTGVTPAQRDALVSWVRTQTSASLDATSAVREVPITAKLWEGNVQVLAGNDIALTSRLPGPCGPNSCGERLWYEPRNAAATFMVEEVASAKISEPALSLTWQDQGRRTLFTGQFGPMAGRTPAFCGPATLLFDRL